MTATLRNEIEATVDDLFESLQIPCDHCGAVVRATVTDPENDPLIYCPICTNDDSGKALPSREIVKALRTLKRLGARFHIAFE